MPNLALYQPNFYSFRTTEELTEPLFEISHGSKRSLDPTVISFPGIGSYIVNLPATFHFIESPDLNYTLSLEDEYARFADNVAKMFRIRSDTEKDTTIAKKHNTYFKVILDYETKDLTTNGDRNKYFNLLDKKIMELSSKFLPMTVFYQI